MGQMIEQQGIVCKQHIKPCQSEPIRGFSAKNVFGHLDIKTYPDCLSRAGAAYRLKYIETAQEREAVTKQEILESLIFIIKNDNSLLVAKIALDTYSELTGFSPVDIFDFENAMRDCENRKIKNSSSADE